MLIWHVMTWKGVPPWPGIPDSSAIRILKKYTQFDIILTGHNHARFHEKYEGRHLVNPGSLTRQIADQIEHSPAVYLWNEKINTVSAHLIPITEGVISREHITREQQKDDRITSFIEGLKSNWEIGLNFEENLEKFKAENHIRASVMEVIYKAIDKEVVG